MFFEDICRMDVILHNMKLSLFFDLCLLVCFNGSQWKVQKYMVMCTYMHLEVYGSECTYFAVSQRKIIEVSNKAFGR